MRNLSGISSLFSNFKSGSTGAFNLSDYALIKKGSYKKLMKAYYAKEDASGNKKATKSDKSQKASEGVDKTGLTKMKGEADKLKSSASVLSSSDIWKQTGGEYDREKILSAVKSFVDDYNSVLSQSSKVSSSDIANNIRWMSGMTTTMSKSLAKLGITAGADGKLELNEETFNKADLNTAKTLFQGSYSYAGQVEAKAGSISTATLASGLYSGNATMTNTLSSLFNKGV